MKKWLITFAGAGYEEMTEQTVRDGVRFGADEVFVYDDKWLLDEEFYQVNRWLWEHQGTHPNAPKGRGFGWYSWKPYILMHALDRMQDGDVVLFIDGDTRPVADYSVVYETSAREGAMFFAASAHSNHRWCTRDAIIVMGQDREMLQRKRYPYVFPETQMAQAGVARFMAVTKGPWRPRQLLCEWLTYAVNPMATTFEPSILAPEHPEFEEHRTEQAILTLLCLKHGYPLYREACEAGEEAHFYTTQPGKYQQLFSQVHQGGKAHPTTGSPFRRIP